MLEEMIKAEEEIAEDSLRKSPSLTNDIFTQFLRENEIIEGDQNYYDDDPNFYEEESTQGFDNVKRKNSF